MIEFVVLTLIYIDIYFLKYIVPELNDSCITCKAKLDIKTYFQRMHCEYKSNSFCSTGRLVVQLCNQTESEVTEEAMTVSHSFDVHP